MSKAFLTYTTNYNNSKTKKTLTLQSGSLFYIDSCTKKYNSQSDLKNSFLYSDKIKNFTNNSIEIGKFNIEYVRNNTYKEILPVLINDNKPMFLRDNFLNNQTSEIETTRKLLYNSKNKMFLKSFLKCKKLYNTTNFMIKMTYDEYLDALDKGLSVIMNEEGYYINVNDLLKYVTINNKLGKLRPLFEDSLEAWKKKINQFNEEGVYYYSRNLRILINEYNKKVRATKTISNLKINGKQIYKIFKHNKNNKLPYKDDVNIEVNKKKKILVEQ